MIIGFRNIDQFNEIKNFETYDNLSPKTLRLFNFYSSKIGNLSDIVK